jgi:uncharacterized membrane protein
MRQPPVVGAATSVVTGTVVGIVVVLVVVVVVVVVVVLTSCVVHARVLSVRGPVDPGSMNDISLTIETQRGRLDAGTVRQRA